MADRDYDSNWFRETLAARGTTACTRYGRYAHALFPTICIAATVIFRREQ
jgi:hypothetical protein